jgi:hypothetical protein
MFGRLSCAYVMCAALSAAAMPVFAITCYEVIDRTNAVVFRDSQTPVDLSTAGAPLLDAMYKRGEQLVIYDTNTCIVIRPSTTGSRKLTTEEIVAGWRSFGNSGFGGTYGSTVATDSGGGIFRPMPTDVGPTPAAQGAAAARGGRY